MNSDFKELLCIFNEAGVRYLVVGGYATMLYTEPRYTKNYDVWVEASNENAERVFRALAKFGAPVAGMSVADFTTPDLVYMMGIPPARIDILTSIEGADFEGAWQRRREVRIQELLACFLSREDLIQNKRAVGRPQDLIDVQSLEGNSK